MINLFLIVILIIYILIRLILYLVVFKYDKFSYDGFYAAGFQYHSEKDIFYSTKNAWQKNFCYAHIYDVMAPIFRMIIDTEPIRFNYDNKNWLITFWKGQYGIVTGAEGGIYCTNQRYVNKKTVYFPTNDSEMLDIDIILNKNGREITRARAKHWLLAIFKLGLFSKLKDLSMDINIKFLNKEMLNVFLESFKKLSYMEKDYVLLDNKFCFRYKKPSTRKVWTRTWITDGIRQFFNRKNVELYNKYFEDFIDNDEYKKLIIVNEFLPILIKNTSSDQKEFRNIIKDIVNDNGGNLVLLNNSVSSGIRSEVND